MIETKRRDCIVLTPEVRENLRTRFISCLAENGWKRIFQQKTQPAWFLIESQGREETRDRLDAGMMKLTLGLSSIMEAGRCKHFSHYYEDLHAKNRDHRLCAEQSFIEFWRDNPVPVWDGIVFVTCHAYHSSRWMGRAPQAHCDCHFMDVPNLVATLSRERRVIIKHRKAKRKIPIGWGRGKWAWGLD